MVRFRFLILLFHIPLFLVALRVIAQQQPINDGTRGSQWYVYYDLIAGLSTVYESARCYLTPNLYLNSFSLK